MNSLLFTGTQANNSSKFSITSIEVILVAVVGLQKWLIYMYQWALTRGYIMISGMVI